MRNMGIKFFDLDLVFFVESKGKQNDMENAACRYGALPGYRTTVLCVQSACLSNDFPADHIDSVLQFCDADSNDETTFHAVWSNQCIELWFLLHFSYMQSDIHREEYC